MYMYIIEEFHTQVEDHWDIWRRKKGRMDMVQLFSLCDSSSHAKLLFSLRLCLWSLLCLCLCLCLCFSLPYIFLHGVNSSYCEPIAIRLHWPTFRSFFFFCRFHCVSLWSVAIRLHETALCSFFTGTGFVLFFYLLHNSFFVLSSPAKLVGRNHSSVFPSAAEL
mgnify:CR=1 FL=1